MQYDAIGFNVRYYRELKGLTQKQLAEGICTQAQISKIEKGAIIPLSSTLYEISKKLGIDVNHFFQIGEHERFDYIEELKKEIRQNIRDRDYAAAMQTLKSHDNDKFFNTVHLRQFRLWHIGICIYHLYGDYAQAIDYIQQALDLTYMGSKIYTEREIEILNSMAVFQDIEGFRQKAHETYMRALNGSVFVPDLNPRIKVRLWYNLSILLASEKRIKESLRAAEEGIQICLREEMLYSFGELLFQKGYCERKLDRKSWKTYFEQAITVFEISHKFHLADMAKEEMDEFNHE